MVPEVPRKFIDWAYGTRRPDDSVQSCLTHSTPVATPPSLAENSTTGVALVEAYRLQ